MAIATGQYTITDLNDSPISTLTNESCTLPANTAGVVSSYVGANTTMNIYLGATDDTSNWSFSASASAEIRGNLSVNTYTVISVVDANDTGYVDITATRSGYASITKRFNISKSKQGQIGVASVKLTLDLPDGNTFQGNVGNSKTINVTLRSGETDITSSATIKWYFDDIENVNLTNLKTLEVYPADVITSKTIKVVATYNSVAYQDSVVFVDLDDVYQVSISGNDKIKNSSENVTLTAIVFRGSTQIFNGFRCRWTDIGTVPNTVIYEGINTTGTLAERGVIITLTPSQINEKLDLLCELSVDSVEQELSNTEEQFVPSYDSKAYAAAMSIALS